MKKLIYSDRVQKSLSVTNGEFDWSAATITGTFTRRDTGDVHMAKPAKGEIFDPKADDTRVFAILDVVGQDEAILKEIGILNGSKGFKESIDIDGDSFTCKPGFEVRAIGNLLEFRVA